MCAPKELNGPKNTRFDTIVVLEETGSTNSDVLNAPRPANMVEIAHHQSAGKGRQGRRWLDDPGTGLLMSVGYVSVDPQPLLSLAAGLAVRRYAFSRGGEVKLKWPNDVLSEKGKLCGILCEARTTATETICAIGIGLNVSKSPDIGETDTLDNVLKIKTTVTEVALGVLVGLEETLALMEHDPGELIDTYSKSCVTLGSEVIAESPQGQVVGVGARIGVGGELVIATQDGTEVVVQAGDVHLK